MFFTNLNHCICDMKTMFGTLDNFRFTHCFELSFHPGITRSIPPSILGFWIFYEKMSKIDKFEKGNLCFSMKNDQNSQIWKEYPLCFFMKKSKMVKIGRFEKDTLYAFPWKNAQNSQIRKGYLLYFFIMKKLSKLINLKRILPMLNENGQNSQIWQG